MVWLTKSKFLSLELSWFRHIADRLFITKLIFLSTRHCREYTYSVTIVQHLLLVFHSPVYQDDIESVLGGRKFVFSSGCYSTVNRPGSTGYKLRYTGCQKANNRSHLFRLPQSSNRIRFCQFFHVLFRIPPCFKILMKHWS